MKNIKVKPVSNLTLFYLKKLGISILITLALITTIPLINLVIVKYVLKLQDYHIHILLSSLQIDSIPLLYVCLFLAVNKFIKIFKTTLSNNFTRFEYFWSNLIFWIVFSIFIGLLSMFSFEISPKGFIYDINAKYLLVHSVTVFILLNMIMIIKTCVKHLWYNHKKVFLSIVGALFLITNLFSIYQIVVLKSLTNENWFGEVVLKLYNTLINVESTHFSVLYFIVVSIVISILCISANYKIIQKGNLKTL